MRTCVVLLGTHQKPGITIRAKRYSTVNNLHMQRAAAVIASHIFRQATLANKTLYQCSKSTGQREQLWTISGPHH